MAKKEGWEKGLGHYSGSDPGLRRDRSVDKSGNPVARPHEIGTFIENLGEPTKLPRNARD